MCETLIKSSRRAEIRSQSTTAIAPSLIVKRKGIRQRDGERAEGEGGRLTISRRRKRRRRRRRGRRRGR
jgi:hypothetical protein